MNKTLFGTVAERLDHNRYDTDADLSHIEVDQAAARATNAGPLLVRVCPANVYSLQPDGSVGVMYAACLECGTCLAVAPPGVLKWHYPRGGKGIIYREG
ncbi:ferredoxin family protein [Martelella alba]|uniref:Ferredoxin-like protein n=1 Tax=Martelella alba TaxID=2590451 RepID=A0ABY2SG88_9HYPH|nr:4Fe-4S dicluster domain-containing protein [Martelella alba]TKI04106.1 ferredoxin [Martelella alba]